jgi:hypothetical protein
MGQGRQSLGSKSRLSNTETLPDPRENVSTATHPLIHAAAQADDVVLRTALQQALETSDDAGIRTALAVQPPARAQRVARLLAAALDANGEGIGLRFFAIPLVIVAGSRKPATVSGALPEVHVLRGLLYCPNHAHMRATTAQMFVECLRNVLTRRIGLVR